MILALNNVKMEFGDRQLFSDASFTVDSGEHIALIGNNGTGKTTLFNIISGRQSCSAGDVNKNKLSTIGYLEQSPVLNDENTLMEELLSARQDIIDLENRINELIILMNESPDNSSLVKEYTEKNSAFEAMDGWSYKSKASGILKGLGFTHEEEWNTKRVRPLSGGERTRLALAKLLFQDLDLLLLDEPTNHLDTMAIEWLEKFLNNYKKAFIIISHDRYFLDKVVSKVIAIENQSIRSYDGNYTSYKEKSESIFLAEQKAYENQQKEIARQEAVIEKLRSFNREKSIKRAESREKLLEKIDIMDMPSKDIASMGLFFNTGTESGKDVLKCEALSKSFGDRTLFSSLNLDIKKGERVALIGENGTGKTTLLKLLVGSLKPNSGSIKLGAAVELGYFDQQHAILSEEKTIFDEIHDSYPKLNNTEVRNTLAGVLFFGDDVFKKIGALSGGEKGRVALAKLMLSDANFLVLDEPTNHLDIKSKEILESSLKAFKGTVLFVSHDRYFLNEVATRTIELKNQAITNYLGNYDYYIIKRDENAEFVEATLNNNKSNWSGDNNQQRLKDKERQAQEKRLKRELEKIEKEIEVMENRISEIDKELSKPEIATNSSKCMELSNERSQCEEKIDSHFGRWNEIEQALK